MFLRLGEARDGIAVELPSVEEAIHEVRAHGSSPGDWAFRSATRDEGFDEGGELERPVTLHAVTGT
ncbi:MAG: hypothetical protein LH616_12365, partial [Ilumatobacteraceae bacterium]|nr:hypothetical protein [Ilumatobacteraceae bacterium]